MPAGIQVSCRHIHIGAWLGAAARDPLSAPPESGCAFAGRAARAVAPLRPPRALRRRLARPVHIGARLVAAARASGTPAGERLLVCGHSGACCRALPPATRASPSPRPPQPNGAWLGTAARDPMSAQPLGGCSFAGRAAHADAPLRPPTRTFALRSNRRSQMSWRTRQTPHMGC